MNKKHILPLAFIVLVFLAACLREESPQGGEAVTVSENQQIPAGPAWHTLALLKTGEHPLWFELGPEGPLLIESPGAATLAPYVPWPHARYIVGKQMWGGFLVMAANREGFLILGTGSEPTELVLYRAADSAFWDPYTAESFFIWDDKPAVILYRNDFFTELSAPALASQVYTLSESSPVPLAANIPAFENFLPQREVEVLRRGPQGSWYFRVREKGQTENDTAYFRTEDLATEGSIVSVEDWRDSNLVALDSSDANPDTGSDLLPALPEGFVYSGVALLGNVLAASWEEQQDAGIGAAGFMVMALGVKDNNDDDS